MPNTAVVNLFGVTGNTLDPIVGTMRANPVNVGTNSKVGSRTGCMPRQDADCSIAVHPVTSEDISGRTLIVVWALELQQNPTEYVLIDGGVLLDSSGNSLVGLVYSDSNFVVTEPVIVPKGTLTFRVGEVSTTTIIVISFTVSVPGAGGRTCLCC